MLGATTAIAIAKDLTAADPTNTTWQRDLSLSYVRLGDVAVSAGKLDDARAWFNKDLVVAKMLAAADSTNPTWQRDLSVSYDRLGNVAMAAGKLDEARVWLDKDLVVAKVLAAIAPTNAGWQRDLCTTLAKIALVARDPNETRRYLDEARGIYDGLRRSSFFQHDIKFTQFGTFLEQLAARIDTAQSVDAVILRCEWAATTRQP